MFGTDTIFFQIFSIHHWLNSQLQTHRYEGQVYLCCNFKDFFPKSKREEKDKGIRREESGKGKQ
jgi:hypothetical protein